MTEKKKKDSGAISRREFLKDAGLLVGGTAIGSTVLLAACGDGETVTEKVTETVTGAGSTSTKTVTTTAPGETQTITVTKTIEVSVGAGENTISLTVNGDLYEIQVKQNWSLQHVLREKLGLTSVKAMCSGYGACGACTVIMNGRPVLSCIRLACECNGAVIETSEGIADSGHPLIEAYVKNHCMQCGYCTPGFVVTAKALLDRNPHPTAEEIALALSGNLCRCSTYPQHTIAVLEAAEELGV